MSAVLQPLPVLALTSIGTFSARSVLTRFCSVLSGYAVLYLLGLAAALRLEGHVDAVVLRVERDLLDPARVELVEELRVHRVRLVVVRADQLPGEKGEHHHDQDGEKRALEESAHRGRRPGRVKPQPSKGVAARWRRERRPARGRGCLPGVAQDRHIWKVAEALRVVETVPDREPVGDLEARVADGQIDLAALGLGQQGADLQRGGIPRLERAKEVGQRQTRVHDVLHDQHVPALDRGVEVLEDAHHPAGVGGGPIRGDRHEVHLARHARGGA